MKEVTYWAFNAVALLAMPFVPAYPVFGFTVVAACLVLTILSFRDRNDNPGNPTLGFLGSLLFWGSIYAVLAYPRIVLSDAAYLAIQVGCFGGAGLDVIWILRVAWRKREANERLAMTESSLEN